MLQFGNGHSVADQQTPCSYSRTATGAVVPNDVGSEGALDTTGLSAMGRAFSAGWATSRVPVSEVHIKVLRWLALGDV